MNRHRAAVIAPIVDDATQVLRHIDSVMDGNERRAERRHRSRHFGRRGAQVLTAIASPH